MASYSLLVGLSHGEFFTRLHLCPLTQRLMPFLLWSNTALPLTSVGHVPSSPVTGMWAARVGRDSATARRMFLQSLCRRCQILPLLVASKLSAMLKLLSCYIRFLGRLGGLVFFSFLLNVLTLARAWPSISQAHVLHLCWG